MILIILLFAATLRLFGINWDQGWHLHPDERMLIMVADRIHFFTNLNPDFFNYGSLPIYILKGIAQIIDQFTSKPVATYDGLLSVGRMISMSADLITLALLYGISLSLFKNKQAAILAALFYALAFFPIQNTHFFVVDVFLNLFITSVVFLLIHYLKKPRLRFAILLGIAAAAAVTTKATGIILLAPIGLTLLSSFSKPFTFHKAGITAIHLFFFTFFLIVCSYIFMPYAFNPFFTISDLIRNPSWETIFNQKLLSDVTLQMKMNSDPFIFPYTLQYVLTTPYLYYLKNIFLYGLGPITSILALAGAGKILIVPFKHNKKINLTEWFKPERKVQVLFLLFYLFYFLILGRSAVKFMRYMLPLYPAFAILAGYGAESIIERLTHSKMTRKKYALATVGITALWTVMFLRIYAIPHTRITASEWIYANIPSGSTLGVEHWDDRLPLPLTGYHTFQFVELPLYEADSSYKWQDMELRLSQLDYMIIASNRLYTPLSKLTECEKLPVGRCYRETAQYYKDLFAGRKGFQIVKEFTSYPGLTIGAHELEYKDDDADESFTVYDHPKVIILKKN